MSQNRQGGHFRDLLVDFHPSLAAATAATAVVHGVGSTVATAATVIDQQQNDDHQQDPVAVIAAEQITQTHIATSFWVTADGVGGHLTFSLYEREEDW